MLPMSWALRRYAAVIFYGFLSFSPAAQLHSQEAKVLDFTPQDHAPARLTPLLIGVNIHYGYQQLLGYFSIAKGIEEMASIGAMSFRDYFPWVSFTFTQWGDKLSGSHRLLELLKSQHNKPLLVLGSANSQVPGGIPPLSDEALVYFQRYLDAVIPLTKSFDPIYEIWNEWNIDTGTTQKFAPLAGAGDPSDPRAAQYYIRMAKPAIEKIKALDPKALILAGAAGDDLKWEWTEAIVRGGVLDHADGLSVHLYNHCMRPQNRTATELIDRVTKLQTILRDICGVAETPIYITEFSWPTSDESCGLSQNAAAYNFAQFILLSATIPWIKGIWMHELKDIGPDPKDRENNFGQFTYDDVPKASSCFVKEASSIVKNAAYIDLRRPFPDVFVLRAVIGDRQKILLWTSSSFVTARYALPPTEEMGSLMCGAQGSRLAFEGDLGPQPAIFTFGASTPVRLTVTQ